ncbi:MAG: hypothetical protein MR424_14070, partial [Treponema sp.]|nr:hypothetical protein [Treponema sp.]
TEIKKSINTGLFWCEGAGRGSKTLFLWLLRSGSSIVSIPQKACSALLCGFESCNCDWEPKIRDFCL